MSISAPAPVRGFRFAGVSAGLKTKAGALDLGIIAAEHPAAATAVFSANHVKAAPVYVTMDRMRRAACRPWSRTPDAPTASPASPG